VREHHDVAQRKNRIESASFDVEHATSYSRL
jgi:hypothetical protein